MGRDIMQSMTITREDRVRQATPIRVAATRIDNPELAAQQLFRELDPHSLSGLVIFASSRYDLNALADAIALRSEGITVVGCTSSGEITPEGFT